MKTIRILVRPLIRGTTTRVDVRAGSGLNSDAFGGNGFNWQPIIGPGGRPKRSQELFDPDFSGSVRLGTAVFSLLIGQARGLPVDWIFLDWQSAPVTIWSEGLGDSDIDFNGLVTSPTRDLVAGSVQLQASTSAAALDVPLCNRSFDGSGGINGDAALRGTIMPSGFGAQNYVPVVWFDDTNQVGMVDGYGNCFGITRLLEGGSAFGPSVGDFVSYAALVAAMIPPGRWGTCIVQGLVRLGAPPFRQITCDCLFGGGTPGTLMSGIIATRTGVAAGLVDADAFTSLDLQLAALFQAQPTIAYWTGAQRQVLDLLQAVAGSCNASPVVTLQGRHSVTRAVRSSPIATIDLSGQRSPRVKSFRAADITAPTWQLLARTARPGIVLSTDQILYETDIVDKGTYNNATVYREGDLVWMPNGSSYLYINETPSSGHIPPNVTYWSTQTVAPVVNFGTQVGGPERPANNATNSADPASAFGTGTVGTVQAAIATAQATITSLQASVLALQNSVSSGDPIDLQPLRDQANQIAADLLTEVQRAIGQEGTLYTQVVTAQSSANGNTSLIQTETIQRATDDGALSARIDTVTATADASAAAVTSEIAARASADAALSIRVDTVSAATGSNTAAIQNVAQTSTTATDALSYRLDQLITAADGSDGNVSTEAAARASADAALAFQINNVSASTGGLATINRNPTFALYAGPNTPDGWVQWNYTGGTPYRVPGINGTPYACHFDVYESGPTGIVQTLELPAGQYVIEASVELTAGTYDGSGIYVDWGNQTGDTFTGFTGAQISFLTAKDTSGYIGNGGFRRTFPFFFDTGASASINRMHLYAMANWSGFGAAMSGKAITFRSVRMRDASALEIAARTAGVDAALAKASVETEIATRTSQTAALALVQQTLTAQLAGTQASGLQTSLQAAITSSSTASANATGALTIVQQQQTAQLANTSPSGLRTSLEGSISSTATAAANATGAVASTVQTLQATVGSQQASLMIQAGAISTLQGRTGVYWQVTGVANGNRAQISLFADANGGGGVDIVGNLTVSGDVLVSGSVLVGALAFGAGGQYSIWFNENLATWNRTDAWGAFAQLQLESADGQTIRGAASFKLSADTTDTAVKFRVRRSGDTIIKAGQSGTGLVVTARTGGDLCALSFVDSVPAGQSTTWYLEVIKASDTSGISIESCDASMQELGRAFVQHSTISVPSGTGPGQGSMGGGNVNGGSAGLVLGPHDYSNSET